ncbi:MAG: outer membrane beta-barrel protein [Phocaeicola vulgatus]
MIVALIAITANAQVYVGGTFGVGSDKVETEGTEVKNTTFKILPEVGYELNEDWSVGTVVGYEYNKSGDVKTNTFTIAPYARYFFLNSDVVRLFADGGFGFSTSKTKGNDALNSWNIGIKPGIAIKLSDHFCLVAKYGFLGYSKKENHGYESENVGIDFDTDELNFGFHYIF